MRVIGNCVPNDKKLKYRLDFIKDKANVQNKL